MDKMGIGFLETGVFGEWLWRVQMWRVRSGFSWLQPPQPACVCLSGEMTLKLWLPRSPGTFFLRVIADGKPTPAQCRWTTLCRCPLDLSKIFRVFIKLVLKFMVYSDNLYPVRSPSSPWRLTKHTRLNPITWFSSYGSIILKKRCP